MSFRAISDDEGPLRRNDKTQEISNSLVDAAASAMIELNEGIKASKPERVGAGAPRFEGASSPSLFEDGGLLRCSDETQGPVEAILEATSIVPPPTALAINEHIKASEPQDDEDEAAGPQGASPSLPVFSHRGRRTRPVLRRDARFYRCQSSSWNC